MSYRTSAEDEAFRRAFEAFEIAPETFDHAAHVRLAYIYLCDDEGIEAAAERMKTSLLRFLGHLGIGEVKYHETITRAWIAAVAYFMAQEEDYDSASAFISRHPRLLDSKIMLRHYSAQVLYSPQARRGFVEPDIESIPRH